MNPTKLSYQMSKTPLHGARAIYAVALIMLPLAGHLDDQSDSVRDLDYQPIILV